MTYTVHCSQALKPLKEHCKRVVRRTALLVALPLASSAQTLETNADLHIKSPNRPLSISCYAIETETHQGAILLEEIEGEAIVSFSFGDVFAQSGESWGYLSAVLGELDGAFLSVKLQIQVEGSNRDESHQWTFIEGGIITNNGTFVHADCGPIDAEYIRRVMN